MAHTFELQANGLLYVRVSGSFAETELDDYLTQLRSYLEPLGADDRLCSLMDATELESVSPEVRRAVTDFVRDPRFGKTAVLGTSRFVKVLIDFLMRASGRNHMRYFTDKAQAIAWLESELAPQH